MLKVFVSTQSTQGDVPGDFCFVPEAELVGRYSLVCAREQSDGTGCGCGRAFAGFETHRGTTTAMVVERDITQLQWRAAMFDTLHSTGWADAMTAEDLARFIDDLVDHDLGAAGELPAGLIVGRRAWNEGDATVDRLTYRGVAAANLGGRA